MRMTQDSQLAKLGLFDAKVPRYTSYPTAPHFRNDVDAGRFATWISQIPAGSEISLYLHVPFCRRLCWFCACRTQGTQTLSPVQAYVELLKQEIDLFAQHLPGGVTLSRLHWGGGTPTLLSPEMMQDLARAIFAVTPMAKDGEFSVEIDPMEIDEPRIDMLAALGMNRASIGVQDFDPQIQDTIGRIQPYDDTRRVVDGLRARGIASLNADILYGLPHQTRERLTESVQKLLSLSPDRVALYGYAHVPWMARRQTMIPTEALPTPQARLGLFDTARRLFTWDGYREIGIDHFALPDDSMAIAQRTGQLRRNFQGYTVDPSPVLVGLGASSISRFQQGYAQNDPSTSAHSAAIRAGQFSTKRGHQFTGEDQLRARMIEKLMCNFEISAPAIAEEFGGGQAQIEALFAEAARAFPGMVEITDGVLCVLSEGRPLTRMIAQVFDAYGMQAAKHSSAI